MTASTPSSWSSSDAARLSGYLQTVTPYGDLDPRPEAERGPMSRLSVLNAYATGTMVRSAAMRRLGYVWYGQLTDAMAAARLHIRLPEPVRRKMDRSIDAVFGGRPA